MTIGVLGAGQLGRMLGLAAIPLAERLRFFSPEPESPAAAVGDLITAPYEDLTALDRFAGGLEVVTYEFESLPVDAAEHLARRVPVRPAPIALQIGQDRWLEKSLFRRLGIGAPEVARVDSLSDLDQAIERVGLPAVLKTRRFGYDGKGQAVLRARAGADAAYAAIAGRPAILEAFVPFEREVSIIAVRGTGGEVRYYPLVENVHREGILTRSRVPASSSARALEPEARRMITRILEELDYVGVLALELFQVGDRLLANEIAPRVHNTGHWTIEGAQTSQFENHLRAIRALPLGDTTATSPCAMLNLIGDAPAPAELLAIEGAHLHLYGKRPAPGRKLGHLTLRASSEAELDDRLARAALLIDAARR